MAQATEQTDTAEAAQLESGTYEIIRQRLRDRGQQLRQRLDQLNAARKDVFGSIETRLVGTDRITTEHNCIPRDIVAVGSKLIFGYNVHFGLKSEIELKDVFAVYEFRDGEFHHLPLELIENADFEKHFRDVYRYYRDTVFAKFFVTGPHLYMVFRVGRSASDIKAFKWLIRDDQLVYLDNRSDHEVRYPSQHEFEWKRTTRDMHHFGDHPHISIEDRVFVETVGGDLTVKIENNTDSGEGIYQEPVDDADQTLDDAEIYFAVLGNIILLKIRPYQERLFRYIVYNEKIQEAKRIDSIEHACVLLPDDHGLIFPNGYYLQSGEYKTFENDLTDLLYERSIRASNGEDFLYIFYNRDSGVHVLLQYNLIEQQVQTPLVCHGATLFTGGELVCFKTHEEPQRHHAIQIWQTPYVGEDATPPADTESMLYKIGNRDIVRAMSECHEILSLLNKDDTYANLYIDIAKKSGDLLDAYFWIDKEEAFRLSEVLAEIRSIATAAIDEFEKVVRVKQATHEQTQAVQKQVRQALAEAGHGRFAAIGEFVDSLARLRTVRGQVVALRDLRYVDEPLVERLEQQVAEQSEQLAARCVQFLLDERALDPYHQAVDRQAEQIDQLERVSEAKQLEGELAKTASELEMLVDIVSNLKIDDATHRTTIIEHISQVFAKLNQARAALRSRMRDRMEAEGEAEFASQMRLLNQAVVNYLDVSDTPERCDEYLTKLMVQIEELEGRFAEFDRFVEQLTEKRDEVYSAFDSRKVALLEARNRRAVTLQNSAERILKGVQARVETFDSIEAIHGYFASDLMIEKVRDIVQQLTELGDSVKADDIEGRMKTIREDGVRQLKDRQDLFVDGQQVIQLGPHRFSVNTQELDLTTVTREDRIHLHLTGTRFFEPLEDEILLHSQDLWNQELVSENRQVYRAEYLAYLWYRQHVGDDVSAAESFLVLDPEQKLATVQKFMGPRYAEGYLKGVHDLDAEKILHAFLEMHTALGPLRFSSRARALAAVYWQFFVEPRMRQRTEARLAGFGNVTQLFPAARRQGYIDDVSRQLEAFCEQSGLFPRTAVDEAARYLVTELTTNQPLVISRQSADQWEALHRHLKASGHEARLKESLAAVKDDPRSRFLLARDWAAAFLSQIGNGQPGDRDPGEVDELAWLLMRDTWDRQDIADGSTRRELTEMKGSHAVLREGRYQLEYHRFLEKLGAYTSDVVPRFQQLNQRKRELVQQAREEMRLEEFRPRVLTSFVRNQLIDQVYLHLVGANLTKQIGVVGEQKRTDRAGLLLLVSPPGYGKTTLMEYIANRLGIIFMKINAPAIGYRVTSLDPAEAPNAAAREELHKLNLALEMGDNIMLYVDDIQHCHPEFLQKFISLCDAQRRIEGVYRGRTRTYDFRGRKVVVAMAGNPYTESGERFQIPDMLANRADVYNLGEVIGGAWEAFEMSFLENALTSNPVLNKLAHRSPHDIQAVIRMAEGAPRESVELEGNYSIEELRELVATMQKLMQVRDIVMKVNREYIRSAAQADAYRTEPPFKLQGSYRNMNRIAERVLPIMNDQELQALILSNYENDAQTLTSDNEANMLKFKELMGILTPEEQARWEDIKRAYVRSVRMQGIDTEDQLGQVLMQLNLFADGLESIRSVMAEGVRHLSSDQAAQQEAQHAEALLGQLGQLRGSLQQLNQAVAEGMGQLAEGSGDRHPTDDRLAEVLDRLATAAGKSDGQSALPPSVTVQHKVPRVVLGVVKAQFKLMQDWMAPVLAASSQQSEELQQLRGAINACLQRYSALIGDLEQAKQGSHSTTPPSDDGPAVG